MEFKGLQILNIKEITVAEERKLQYIDDPAMVGSIEVPEPEVQEFKVVADLRDIVFANTYVDTVLNTNVMQFGDKETSYTVLYEKEKFRVLKQIIKNNNEKYLKEVGIEYNEE